jgi:hypothetical protein
MVLFILPLRDLAFYARSAAGHVTTTQKNGARR